VSGELLRPEFIRRLARLRVLARRRFAGAAGGTRRSTRRGSSAEFADHRPYYHGDDVRRIDWNAYARLEELVLRLYVAEEDLTVYLLVDSSRSMAVGDPPKIEVAKRIAAALGYVALTGSERVSVVPFGPGIRKPMPPVRGKRKVGALLRHLDAIAADGETDLGRAVDELLARRSRPGVVAVISDLLDPGGYQRPLDRLISERFEPAIFHVLDPEELDPTPGGDLVLVDAERGSRLEVSLDARAIAAYRGRLHAFLEGTRGWAKRRGASYVRLCGESDFEDALLDYLRAA
jgi:uncharacterized protein (DUF58 family)